MPCTSMTFLVPGLGHRVLTLVPEASGLSNAGTGPALGQRQRRRDKKRTEDAEMPSTRSGRALHAPVFRRPLAAAHAVAGTPPRDRARHPPAPMAVHLI